MIRIIALILLAVSAAGADTNWEALRALKTGERVVIVDSKMRKHQGKLTHWDENAIQVDTETGPVSVERANVARVSTAERKTQEQAEARLVEPRQAERLAASR